MLVAAIIVVACVVVALVNQKDVVTYLIVGVIAAAVVNVVSYNLNKPTRLMAWQDAKGLQKLVAWPTPMGTPKLKLASAKK